MDLMNAKQIEIEIEIEILSIHCQFQLRAEYVRIFY